MLDSEDKYEVVTIYLEVTKDTTGILSDCMSISFTNQGTTDAYIRPDTSGGSYLRMSPGQERSYSLVSPNIKYRSKFDVVFKTVSGSNAVLIEKEYVEKIKTNKNCR